MSLTVVDALTAYAAMLNTRDASRLEPLLADDFHYASQKVFHEIASKAEYMEYIVGELETLEDAGFEVWAEIGELTYGFPGPCVVVAQGEWHCRSSPARVHPLRHLDSEAVDFRAASESFSPVRWFSEVGRRRGDAGTSDGAWMLDMTALLAGAEWRS